MLAAKIKQSKSRINVNNKLNETNNIQPISNNQHTITSNFVFESNNNSLYTTNNNEESEYFIEYADEISEESLRKDLKPFLSYASTTEFSIKFKIETMLQNRKRSKTLIDVMFCDGSQYTKQQVSQFIQQYISERKETFAGTLTLLQLLHKILPDAKLPIRSTSNGNIVSDLDSLFDVNEFILEQNCCPCGGTVYFDSKSEKCDLCGLSQFLRCTVSGCKGDASCKHSLSYRTPRKTLHYIPITFTLIRLLSDVNKTFLQAIHYTNDNILYNKEGKYNNNFN